VHDLGVLKALGMTPRHTVTTVLASVALVGASFVIAIDGALLLAGWAANARTATAPRTE